MQISIEIFLAAAPSIFALGAFYISVEELKKDLKHIAEHNSKQRGIIKKRVSLLECQLFKVAERLRKLDAISDDTLFSFSCEWDDSEDYL